MANILSIVNQQLTAIEEEKLRILCSRQNVWDHFGINREAFLMLSEAKQLQMVRIFYFDNLSNLFRSNGFNIDLSIGSAIRNSAGISMKKVIENGDDRTEVTVATVNSEEKVKKSINLCENFGYFST